MSSTFWIFAAGCVVFTIVTLAALWVGYLYLQRAWVAENPQLTSEDDEIRPLFSRSYPEQRGEVNSRPDQTTPVGSAGPPPTDKPIEGPPESNV